jgi:hypothetical protein
MMRYTLLAGASAVAMCFVSPAMAAGGDIVLTGHDNDLHCGGGPGGPSGASGPCAVLGAEVNFARNGSSLPVLTFDARSELTSSLTFEGIPWVNINPDTPGAITGALFNHSIYSAFVVASVTSCGGCDNPSGTGTKLAAFETSIAAFFNAGGGIVGLTGAGDPNAYAYVPEAGGTTTPIFSSSGFDTTAAGLAGIPGFSAVNGDETHNTFAGFASFYSVAETFGTDGPAVTLFGSGGTISCTGPSCTITGGTPEPSTWTMMVLGFFGLAYAANRTRKRRQLHALV